MKLPGRKKFILLALMLFGPGLLLIILSKGEQKFNFLKSVGEIGAYQFYDIDSNVISSKTDTYEIVIFTTIQNSCFDNSNTSCRIYPYYIEEFFYREYKKSPKKFEGVKIYSIVTDKDGLPVAPNQLLIEEFQKYDSQFWELLIGDPKQIYGFEKEGTVFTDLKDEEGNFEFVRMGVLVSEKNQIKAIRPLDREAFVREFNERFKLVLKEKQIKKYNESR